MQIKTRTYQRSVLALGFANSAGSGVEGPAHGLHAHLVTGFTRPPDDLTVWDDLVVADYTGYASQALALADDGFDALTGRHMLSVALTWAATDAANPNMIVAVVYTNSGSAGGDVRGIDLLDPAVPMADADSGFATVSVIDFPWHRDGRPPYVIR